MTLGAGANLISIIVLLPRRLSIPERLQAEQQDGDKDVDEDHKEVAVGAVGILDHIYQMALSRSEHEEGPAEPGREPETVANPDAAEAEDAPRSVMEADLKLEMTARLPADNLRGVVGEEDVRDEASTPTRRPRNSNRSAA